jgi:hypothetical protein
MRCKKPSSFAISDNQSFLYYEMQFLLFYIFKIITFAKVGH